MYSIFVVYAHRAVSKVRLCINALREIRLRIQAVSEIRLQPIVRKQRK